MDYELQEGFDIAKPSLTYGHGWLTDCDDKTDWDKGDSADPLTDPSITVLHGDWFKIGGTTDSDNDEWVHYRKTIPGSLKTNTYKYVKIRWKTQYAQSETYQYLGARAIVYYTGGTPSSKFVVGETQPEFSTTWQVTTAELHSDRTLSNIRFYADDYPNTGTNAESYVYFDFALFYTDTFMFPHVGIPGKVDFHPPNRFVDIPIPTRVTDVTQNLGAESATVNIVGDMELGSWGTPKGDKLLNILHNASSEPWQWFTCDEPKVNMKVTMRDFNPFYEAGQDGKPRYSVLLKEYSLSCKSNESYAERFGI